MPVVNTGTSPSFKSHQTVRLRTDDLVPLVASEPVSVTIDYKNPWPTSTHTRVMSVG